MSDTPSKTTDADTPWRPIDAFRRPFGMDLPILLVPFAVVAAVMGLVPLRNWDYWWHISVGRVIDVYGAVPDKNHYLYTVSEDAASFVQPWLSDWIMVWLHDIGGIYLGLTARNLLAAAAFTVVGIVAARRAGHPAIGAILAVVGFVVAAPTLFAGPTVFATALFGIVVAVAYGVRERALPKLALVALPLAAALWANMDPAFLLPAGVSLAFLLGSFLGGHGDESFDIDYRIAWAVTLAACVAAPLLNPRGAELFGYLTDVVFDLSLRDHVSYGLSIGHYGLELPGIVFFGGLAVALVSTPRKLDAIDRTDLCVIVLAFLTAFWNARLLPFLGIILTAAAARHAASLLSRWRWSPPAGSPLKSVFAALMVLLVGFGMQRLTEPQNSLINSLQPFEARQEEPLAGVVPPETPVIHTEILDGLALVPRLYHDRRYAGFLIFGLANGEPAPIVFVDPRVELPGADVWRLYDVLNGAQAWRGTFQQYGVNAAIINKHTQPDLARAMALRDNWDIAYEDEYNALFVRQ